MTDRTVRDILVPFGWSGLVCKTLDLDPDAILDRDCPTCGGIGRVKGQYLGGTTHPRAIAIEGFATPCPDCDGTGRQPVAKVMVVPICVCGQNGTLSVHHRSDGPCYHVDNGMTDDDERALHIGRAVLACVEVDNDYVEEVELHGTRHYAAVGLLDALVAAGEVEG